MAKAALALLAVVVLRCAWVGDDAYITLRTVDNIVHGYGAVWNPGERVQAYTHPLWMLLLLLPYAVLRDAFVMPMVLGTVLSVCAAWVVGQKLARSTTYAVLAIAVLGLSRSFVDYSTAGLENSLSHLLLALFFVVYVRHDGGQKSLTRLYLLMALLATTRADLVLLVAPAVGLASWKKPWRVVVQSAAVGLSPLLAWEAFSLVYYGSLVPNTALSKLAHGLPRTQLLRQGWVYAVRQLEFDPLSVVTMVVAVWSSLRNLRCRSKWAVIGIGILAYVMYVISIGGGFMAGRFFTAPFFASLCLLVATRAAETEGDTDRIRSDAWAVGVFVAMLGFLARSPTPLFDDSEATIKEGIVDERRFWGRNNALLGLRRTTKRPYHSLVADARRVRERGDTLVVRDAVGMFGYHVGPGVTVVDRYALADAFLARFPTMRIDPWRPGHLQRTGPAGYLQTMQTGEAHFVDEDVAELWRQVRLVTSGPLFSADRWRAIWQLNTGQLDHLVDVDFYKRPYYDTIPAEVMSFELPAGHRWDGVGAVFVHPDRTLSVSLGRVVHHDELTMSAGTNDGYRVDFIHGEQKVGSVKYPPLRGKEKKGKSGLHERPVLVPVSATDAGYDTVIIERDGKDRRLTVGHLIFPAEAETEAEATPRKRKGKGRRRRKGKRGANRLAPAPGEAPAPGDAPH